MLSIYNKWRLNIMLKTTLALAFIFLGFSLAFGQATSQTAIGVTCAADGSSTQVRASNARRVSWSIINDSATDIRVGFLTSGTADLTDSNSFILKAGSSFSDSLPNVYAGRVVCMSTTGSTVDVHSTEALK
jgi:hypothetical protein